MTKKKCLCKGLRVLCCNKWVCSWWGAIHCYSLQLYLVFPVTRDRTFNFIWCKSENAREGVVKKEKYCPTFFAELCDSYSTLTNLLCKPHSVFGLKYVSYYILLESKFVCKKKISKNWWNQTNMEYIYNQKSWKEVQGKKTLAPYASVGLTVQQDK